MVSATITSGGLGSVTVEGLGYRSLSDATIICESVDTCLLKCSSGACDSSTNYVCLDGATCNLNPKQCLTRSTFRGMTCPTISTTIPQDKDEMNVEDIDDELYGMDMELFGDIDVIINNDHHHQGNMLINISIFVVIGIALLIFVSIIYYKSDGSDKYLELK